MTYEDFVAIISDIQLTLGVLYVPICVQTPGRSYLGYNWALVDGADSTTHPAVLLTKAGQPSVYIPFGAITAIYAAGDADIETET